MGRTAQANIRFRLTAKRDVKAAKRFFKKAIGSSAVPEKITIDKSGANKAAAESLGISFVESAPASPGVDGIKKVKEFFLCRMARLSKRSAMLSPTTWTACPHRQS